MTITSSRYVEPILASEATNGKKSPRSPQRLWYAVEPPFKGYQPTPSEAYAQSGADTAIIIDNGKHPSVQHFGGCVLSFLEAQVLYGLAGPSIQSLEYHFPLMSLVIETENTTGPSHMWVTMRMRTPLQGARYGMLSNLGPVLWVIGMSWKVCWIIYL